MAIQFIGLSAVGNLKDGYRRMLADPEKFNPPNGYDSALKFLRLSAES